jgi:hypothetical protein
MLFSGIRASADDAQINAVISDSDRSRLRFTRSSLFAGAIAAQFAAAKWRNHAQNGW